VRIHIVCYEDLDAWICGKIAQRLFDAVVSLGHQVTISNLANPKAQINHHIIYLNYRPCLHSIDTLMVTHIDNATKLKRLEQGLESARAAICMSQQAVASLTVLGIAPEKLHYAHMASDGRAIARKIVVGISTRLYPDGRKGETDFVRLLSEISPSDFSFKILGFGWADIVANMRTRGFDVTFEADFEYEKYLQMLSMLDYFIYLGEDEGSAAFIDALAAGVRTIVKPQGFHLDAPGGITHSFTSYDELRKIFFCLAAERQALLASVAEWTWQNYARKHVAIWEACWSAKSSNQQAAISRSFASSMKMHYGRAGLWLNLLLQRIRMVLNIKKDYECGSRWWNRRRK
jgi:hypothetical protein